jgi:hypothetical protein
MIEAGKPGWPMASVTRAVTRVSPSGNASSEPIPSCGQNWTRVAALTKAASCEALRVHASPVVVRASNRQARSLMALATLWSPPNCGGSTAGTPPIGGSGPLSQTSVLPLPSARETRIWKLGSAFGSVGTELNVVVPTGRLLGPGLASTTMKKPSGSCRR